MLKINHLASGSDFLYAADGISAATEATPPEAPTSEATTPAMDSGPSGSEQPLAIGTSEAPAMDGAPAETQPSFHSFTYDDGEQVNLGSKDDLDKHLRETGFRYKDYTRKNQEVAELRRQLDGERSKFDNEYSSFLEMKRKYDGYDESLRGLSPEQFKQFQGLVSGSQNDMSQPPEWATQMRQEWEQERSTRQRETARKQAEDNRNAVYERLGTTVQGFDRAAVEAEMQRIRQLPERMQLEALIESAHYGLVGRKRTQDIASSLKTNEQRANATFPGAGGATAEISAVAPAETVPVSLEDAKAAAKRALKVK